jgi:hypothetical protein
MHGAGGRKRWAALVVLALLVTVGLTVGFVAYNAGVSHGVAIAAAHAPDLERGAGEGARAVMPAHGYYGYGYGWHPWGFGFFFGPFLFILFWFVLLKALFFRAFTWGRGGPWRYRDYGYGPGPWHGGGPWGGFDDWHRRAHERMHDEPPSHL